MMYMNSRKSKLEIEERYDYYAESLKKKKKRDKTLSEREFYRLHILNEKNRKIDVNVINAVFKKYGLDHKVKNLAMFQKAFIHESYIEDNIMKNKYLRQIKDTPMISDPSMAIPLIDRVPVIDKKNRGEMYVLNINHNKKTHKVAKSVKKSILKPSLSYERLEFLGDAVIHDAIAHYLYFRYGDQDQGFLTTLRTRLENGKTQSELCKCLGIHEYMVISRCMERIGARYNNYKVIEDIFEAFIGALCQEINREECFKFVINIIEREADISNMIHTEDNYKGELMKECHKRNWEHVKYTDVTDQVDREPSDKNFYIEASCGDSVSSYKGFGGGKAKKDGEKEAARDILQQLKLQSSSKSNKKSIKHNVDDEPCEYSASDTEEDSDNDESKDTDSAEICYSCSDSEDVYGDASDSD